MMLASVKQAKAVKNGTLNRDDSLFYTLREDESSNTDNDNKNEVSLQDNNKANVVCAHGNVVKSTTTQNQSAYEHLFKTTLAGIDDNAIKSEKNRNSSLQKTEFATDNQAFYIHDEVGNSAEAIELRNMNYYEPRNVKVNVIQQRRGTFSTLSQSNEAFLEEHTKNRSDSQISLDESVLEEYDFLTQDQGITNQTFTYKEKINVNEFVEISL